MNRRHFFVKLLLLIAIGTFGALSFLYLANSSDTNKAIQRGTDTNEVLANQDETPPVTDEKPQEKPQEKPDEAEVLHETSTSINAISTIDCTDCTFAAVDKLHSLPASYTPMTIATNLPGGGTLVPDAANALQKLFQAASKKGTQLEVISAYRSFDTQQTTFEYWVGTEVAKGNSRQAAETIANTYSARPGQSEHQLGTTVDVKCAGCADFSETQNASAYQFIENNAHLYGFAISYPKGQDELTGYTYEPWHIRWIGTELASELFDTGYTQGNGVYLANFLRTKNL